MKYSHLSQLEIGYIAGLIDSKGCFGVSRKKPGGGKSGNTLDWNIHFGSTNREIIIWLTEEKGVFDNFYIGGKTKTGKDFYVAYLNSKESCKEFLETFLPFLRIKREVASVMLELIKLYNPKRGKRYELSPKEVCLYEKIRRLNSNKGGRKK